MSAIKGDFIGFSFGDKHCSDFNIVRVSDGSRYNESLLPSYQDTIQPRVGADGSYYWNGFYTQKTFSISFAFDSMTEQDFRGMRQWLGQKGLFPLIFDEAPYKQWMARAQEPQLNFICFDGKDENGNIVRIYKGEGSVQFIAPYPFARGVVKSKADYNAQNPIPDNFEEWNGAIGLPDNTPSFGTDSSINLVNCGDLPMDFILKFKASDAKVKIALAQSGASLTIPCTINYEYEINTATHLIYETDNEGTKRLKGQNQVVGDFFKIPIGTVASPVTLKVTKENNTTGAATNLEINYSYLFY